MKRVARSRHVLATLTLALTALLVTAATFRSTSAASDPSLTGVWAGTLSVDGLPRALAIELHQRADGRVLGYVLGGTSAWTVVSGGFADRHVNLVLEQKSLAGVRTLTFFGKFSGNKKIKADVNDGSSTQNVTLQRVDTVVERRLLFAAVDSAGEPNSINELAVALDGTGAVVAGAFVGQDNCGPWSCEGAITAFAEAGGVLTLGFAAPGGCTAGSSASFTFDATTKFYSGSYTQNTCEGPRSGDLLAVRTSRTISPDVAQVLAGLGRLADDFEGGVALTPPHPSFSPAYMDSGLSLADLLEDYSAEIASHTSIQATFNRVRLVHTVPDPDSFPDLPQIVGAVFEELRSGVPTGGTVPVTYVDSVAMPAPSKLRIWANEAGGWVIRGNGTPPLDFPFANSVTTDALGVRRFEAPTNGGLNTIYVTALPFGAHFEPLTGHAYGDTKGNLIGFYTRDDSDLTVLSPTLRAYFGGVGGSLLLQRRPLYVAPLAGTINLISCVTPAPTPITGQGQWDIEITFDREEGDGMKIGHVGEIHADMRAKILDATGLDLTTCPSPGTGNLLGGASIPLAAGEAIAWPQVVARSVGGGYFQGGGTVGDRPWAQMEFFYFGPGRGCFYDAIARPKHRDLQAILVADMADPLSQLFRNPMFQAVKWRWTAESRMCMAASRLPDDFSDLYTALGGWFETPAPTIATDELVAFAPIAKDTAAYDPARYDSPAVNMLVTRRHAFFAPFRWLLPGDTVPLVVSPPHGEILERTPDTLLVKWRDLGRGGPFVYQRATYLLDSAGLRVNWSGNFALTAAAAIAPAPVAGLACDGAAVICYDHTERSGY